MDMETDIWRLRKQRRTFHQPRLRQECIGALIQVDGSDALCFEDCGEPCTLLAKHDGRVAFYSNKHTRCSALQSPSSQAMGRVERPNRTLQGRLVKDL